MSVRFVLKIGFDNSGSGALKSQELSWWHPKSGAC
jgi:hypothetical protein